MAFLKYQGSYVDVPRPHLILLDLCMPKLGGLEVLVQIKSDVGLRTIPIAVLTTSCRETDIEKCYQLMANCYLAEPKELAEFESLVKSLNDFWLTRVTFHRTPYTVNSR